jgi:hypothetical protein
MDVIARRAFLPTKQSPLQTGIASPYLIAVAAVCNPATSLPTAGAIR